MGTEIFANPLRGKGFADMTGMAEGDMETDARVAQALYAHCPINHQTALDSHVALAGEFGVGKLWLKMEDQRMGLGSFKALGAAHAIAKLATAKVDVADKDAMATALAGETLICASAGNHGLSLAAGAKLFGARAVVLLAVTVPEEFAERLRALGADVMRAGANYEESLATSIQMADENGWYLLADGTWPGYTEPARAVMEGYLIMGQEVADQMSEPPTHVFLQAGVGGLASACAVTARDRWGEDVCLVVVEPEAAPALIERVKAGKSVDTKGPVSSMGRLDCKTPSHLALKYLAKEADFYVTLDDDLVEETVALLEKHNVHTTPSGGAGVAAVHHLAKQGAFGLNADSNVLCYISEGIA